MESAGLLKLEILFGYLITTIAASFMYMVSRGDIIRGGCVRYWWRGRDGRYYALGCVRYCVGGGVRYCMGGDVRYWDGMGDITLYAV